MEIGDEVNVLIEKSEKNGKPNTPDSLFTGDGRVPTSGIVEQMYERFALLMMITDLGKQLYRKCYFYNQIQEKGNKVEG